MDEMIQTLEHHAIDAHRAGKTWTQFWERHGREVCRAEPVNRQRFRKLVDRLLSLVTSGDTSGLNTLESPWDADDVPLVNVVSDTRTQARCLLPLLAIPGLTTADRLPPRGY